MLKKVFYSFLGIVTILIVFLHLFLVNIFGVIPGEKDSIEKGINRIRFTSNINGDFEFSYANKNNHYLLELRKKYNLDSIIAQAKNDLEKVLLINSWVQSRWEHDGYNMAEKNDALYILAEAEKGRKFRCVEFGIVAKACLDAIGLKSRTLGLRTKDVEEVPSGAGHVATETFLNDEKKWIFLDPQWDVVVIKDGLPLNAVELQQSIYEKDSLVIKSSDSTLTITNYIDWISPYLFYFNVRFDNSINSITIWDRVWNTILANKTHLTLVPLGAKEPHLFQRIFRMKTSLYTNSIKDFYSVPNTK